MGKTSKRRKKRPRPTRAAPARPTTPPQPPTAAADPVAVGSTGSAARTGEGWNPGPFVLDRTKGVVVDGILTLVLSGVLVAAARNSGGWLRLVLALLTVSVFAGIYQMFGAWFARDVRREASRGTYAFVTYVFLPITVLVVLFGPTLFAFMGISPHQRDTIMLGAAIGAVVAVAGWLLGLRFLYRPPTFPRWWLRGSMQVTIAFGAAVALAVSR